MKSMNPDHDGEHDGEEGGFEDPEDGEADDLQQREQVNSPEWNMAQVGVVWLVLCWHEEQLDPVPELWHERTNVSNYLPKKGLLMRQNFDSLIAAN